MVTMATPNGTHNALYDSFLKQTHLLVAGCSGSGKSVLVNGIITAGLYHHPFNSKGGIQYILIDPKRVELAPYRNLPHTIGYASEPDEMVCLLESAVSITEKRYKEMMAKGMRKYDGSDIYVIIEELADLMTTNRRAVQPMIQRLCQIARAARVHVIAVTQCPIVKVIPTEIKVNFDSVVALRTRSAQDSRNIIGHNGAENLPKYGECLYYTPDNMHTMKCVVPMVEEDEMYRLINHWEAQERLAMASRQTTTVHTEEKKGFFRRLFKKGA